MDSTTARLVDFARAFHARPLPAAAVHECKRRLIDTVGCAFGGSREPVSAMARRLVAPTPAGTGVCLWGSAGRSTPEGAAFANGVLVRAMDMSDTYIGRSGGHPSDMTAGIWAVAEAAGASGAALLKAVALAYEVYCGLADVVDLNAGGWDHPVYGGPAGALAIGCLLGLDREQLGHAVSLSLIPNMALYQTRQGEPSSWRNCAGAHAARHAVFAVQAAREGLAGPGAAFEGRSGLWRVSGRFDWQPPGEEAAPKVGQTHMKSLPVCYHGQAAAWAAIEARGRIDPANIESIEVATFRQAVAAMGADATRWAPDSRETADHSLPFVVATGLLHGEISSRSYGPERLADPAIAALMAKVKVSEDQALSALYPQASAARLSIQLRGTAPLVIEMKHPRGHAEVPMSDADVEAKFLDLYGVHGGEAEGRVLLQALWALEALRDVRGMAPLLAGSS